MSAAPEQPKRPRGRPAGSGEGRDTPITWRTTAERRERLTDAVTRLEVSQATALDEALDAWLAKQERAARRS